MEGLRRMIMGKLSVFPVWNETSNQWTLSPIAEFTQDDIFETIGMVTSGQIKTYSDFVALTQVYRDSAAGEHGELIC